MAQDQTVTDEGIQELILLWSSTGASGGTGLRSITCLSSTGVCTVANDDFYSSTGGAAAVPTTAAALDVTDIDTVSVTTVNTTGDTITFDHIFTSTGSFNVSGIMVLNDDDDTSYVECCFASVIAMEATDTLTIDGQVTIDQAST